MQRPQKSFAQDILRQLAWHGVLALAIAVAFLIMLRGAKLGIIVLFGLPPTVAALMTGAERASPRTRLVAWTFLAAVGIGAGIAHFPQVFPKLGGFDPQLPRWQDRMLMWYTVVYLFWIQSVVPLHAFTANLQAHQRGDTAQLSQATCYLGLFTSGLLTIGFPALLPLLGFWPII
ncbi:MAG TPA: hypothetical protein VFB96_23375 [Pirellulaceae bacterium]|nr:hypothetical protein [Pirellulaceae bacterium]